jgi:hypothetical protein
MPVVYSNSGNSCSYAPLNPPDISTFSSADAAAGQINDVARTLAVVLIDLAVSNATVIMLSPRRSRLCSDRF